MEQVINFLKETKAEMKHVSWPTKDQTIAFTLLVIAISFIVAFLLGGLDVACKKALELLLAK